MKAAAEIIGLFLSVSYAAILLLRCVVALRAQPQPSGIFTSATLAVLCEMLFLIFAMAIVFAVRRA